MKTIKIILNLLLVSLAFSACTYYKVVQPKSLNTNPEAFKELGNRTIILHGKRGIYHVANPGFDQTGKIISGVLDTVPEAHKFYLHNTRTNERYKKSQVAIITEAHIFSGVDSTATYGNKIEIPAASIDRVDIIKKDKTRNTLQIAGIALVIGLTVLVLIYPPVSVPI